MEIINDKKFRDFYEKHRSVIIGGKIIPLRPDVKSSDLLLPEFTPPKTTVLDFKSRGRWLTHPLNSMYPGNTSPKVIRTLLEYLTKEGDIVIDPMCGSGTTAIECASMKRPFIVFDVNINAAMITYSNLIPIKKLYDFQGIVGVGDAKKEKIDKVATLTFIHPPYASLIKYSKEPNDVSNLKYNDFLGAMTLIISNAISWTKKYIAIQVGDFKKNGRQILLTHDIYEIMRTLGLKPKYTFIKIQNNTTFGRFIKSQSPPYINHEIIYVMEV